MLYYILEIFFLFTIIVSHFVHYSKKKNEPIGTTKKCALRTNPNFIFLFTTQKKRYGKQGPMKLIGASVLPYAIDPQHNQVFFLLGSERHLPRWQDSGKFSDFGGSVKYKEETSTNCAAREFFEETCCVVPWGETDEPILQSFEPIQNALENEEYTMCLRTDIDRARMYYTYVKQIPFRPNIPRFASHITNNLLRIRNIVKANGKYTFEKNDTCINHPAIRKNELGECVGVSRDYIEKQQLLWISISHAKMLLDGTLPENRSDRYRKTPQFRPGFHERFRVVVDAFFKSIVRLKDSIKICVRDKQNDNHEQYNTSAKPGPSKHVQPDHRKCPTVGRPRSKYTNSKIPSATSGGQKQPGNSIETSSATICRHPPCPPKSAVQVQSTNVPDIGSLQLH